MFHLFLCFDSHGPRDAGGARPTRAAILIKLILLDLGVELLFSKNGIFPPSLAYTHIVSITSTAHSRVLPLDIRAVIVAGSFACLTTVIWGHVSIFVKDITCECMASSV